MYLPRPDDQLGGRVQRPGLIQGVDAASSATPMAVLHTGAVPDLTLGQMLLGQHGGAMGGVPVLMLLLGGLYLVSRRVITPRIPLAYLGTVALLTLLFPRGDEGALAWMTAPAVLRRIGDGGCLMASDYTTTPVTPLGQTIFGVGCGRAHRTARYFGSYPDGVGWAILTMNCCVWLMDRAAIPRRFGMGRFALVRSWGQQLKESVSTIHFVPPKLKFLARAGEGTMPGEGYLDELKGKVRQWAALGGVAPGRVPDDLRCPPGTDYAAVRAETEAQEALLDQVMPQATVRTETPIMPPGPLALRRATTTAVWWATVWRSRPTASAV